jgi:hypothetical protein
MYLLSSTVQDNEIQASPNPSKGGELITGTENIWTLNRKDNSWSSFPLSFGEGRGEAYR